MPKCKDCNCELEYAWYFDDNGNILFTIEFDKTISFQERGNVSNTLYAYPEKSYHATVLVKYYLNEEKGNYKKCSRCGQIKLAHNKYFSKNKTSKDGFYSICKDCRNSKTKKYIK